MNLSVESFPETTIELFGDYPSLERDKTFTLAAGLTFRVKDIRWEITSEGVRDAGVELEIVSEL